jgi:glycosyltransferase involved in cell wall biosynthesis
MICFAEWLNRGGDGFLWLHCAKKDAGWDLVELARYLGIQDRVFMPGVQNIEDMPEDVLMPLFYSMVDVGVSNTLGEGWGLTTMEMMACGIPQMAPDWSALAEWARPAARMIPCSAVEVLSGYHTFGIGGIADQEKYIEALDEIASSPMLRQEMSRLGLDLVKRIEYRWESVARKFNFNFAGLLATRAARPKPKIRPWQSELDKLAEAIAA